MSLVLLWKSEMLSLYNLLLAERYKGLLLLRIQNQNSLTVYYWITGTNIWDEYAQKRNELGHIIFILQLRKVKSWDGTPLIHNALFGTKMFINRDFLEIEAFRQRFKELPKYDENQFKISVFIPQKPFVTSASFIDNIRRYNSMFAFNSMGDVIGSVVEIGDVVPVQSATGRKIQRIVVIKDSESNQLGCILWDHWANMWDEYAQKRNELGHIIFILQLRKVKSWDEIEAFRQRFKELPEYNENQFKISLFTPQKPFVTSASFIDNIRRYNSMFAFNSMGGKQNTSVNVGRVHTATDYMNRSNIRDLLDEINPLVQDFHRADERIRSSDDEKISLRLIVTRQRDGRQYNLPTASEVAVLIVGDFDSTKHKRDIILHCQDGDFKRI
nr:plant OB fold protein [Tanacetum cinerariifolium]